MTLSRTPISELGEKRLIAEMIKPMFNPEARPEGVGDDCALIPVGDEYVCVSTDRVPADLIAFRLGIIGFEGLGYYLAVLNISDIAACGGTPRALLLNLALPSHFMVEDLRSILAGVCRASKTYNVPVLGGDLSNSAEMSLVAVALGTVPKASLLARSGARPGHKLFCSKVVGLTPTAFAHLLRDRSEQAPLSSTELKRLTMNFSEPIAMVEFSSRLARMGACSSAMDVTDGVAQSFLELAFASDCAFNLFAESLPIDPVSMKLAEEYERDVVDMVLGAGADFQIVGTLDPDHSEYSAALKEVTIIGEVSEGEGLRLRRDATSAPTEYLPSGWNYFSGTE